MTGAPPTTSLNENPNPDPSPGHPASSILLTSVLFAGHSNKLDLTTCDQLIQKAVCCATLLMLRPPLKLRMTTLFVLSPQLQQLGLPWLPVTRPCCLTIPLNQST